jgi:ribose transport system permease protein
VNRAPSANRTSSTISRLIANQGLLLLTIVLIIVFSITLPNTFPTLLTAQSILSDRSTIAFLALAEMIVISAGQFDLSIGYGIGLAHILAVGLQVKAGVPWPLAVVIVLVSGALIGLINGLLVRLAKIDSFIATLGIGTILYAVSEWYTGGQQISGTLPPAFIAINGAAPLGIPIAAVYVVIIAVVMWMAFDYLPIGRYLYAIGSNERAAELIGIPITRYVIGAFVASGTLTAFAGVVLGAKLQVGQSNIGPEYLLPAFVGALLGSTSVKPGRVNVWGTIIAVLILAVGISGIQQLGASFFVEPLFNGLTLIVAVGLAGYFARRRLRVAVALPDPMPPSTPLPSTATTSQGAPAP